MPITFNCPHCQTSITTTDSGAGQQGKCSSCGATVIAPSLVTVPVFEQTPLPIASEPPEQVMPATKHCPKCGEVVRAEAVLCKHCKASLKEDPALAPPFAVPATKVCPLCAEEIRAEAKLCKHCKSPQPSTVEPPCSTVAHMPQHTEQTSSLATLKAAEMNVTSSASPPKHTAVTVDTHAGSPVLPSNIRWPEIVTQLSSRGSLGLRSHVGRTIG